MRCRYCKTDKGVLAIVPEDPNAVDSSLSAFTCLRCAIKKGIFCAKHKQAHQAFEGGKHLCLLCVEEERARLEPYQTQIVDLCRELIKQLSEDEAETFHENISIGAQAIGQSEENQLLRFVTVRMMLSGKSVDELIRFVNNPVSDQMPFSLTD